MLGRLIIAFTLIPAIELYLLIKVGGVIGAERTLLVIILTGVAGAYLARREGVRIFFSVQEKLSQGQMPGNEMVDGLLILLSGAFLVTPGFVTDIAGFSMLVPQARTVVREYLKTYFKDRVAMQTMRPPGQGPWEPPV
jgi:UPF0716 protein FxsA